MSGRDRARAAKQQAAEQRARKYLGMAPGHPESVTRSPSKRERAELRQVQDRLWPECEWADLLRVWLEDGTWGEKR